MWKSSKTVVFEDAVSTVAHINQISCKTKNCLQRLSTY